MINSSSIIAFIQFAEDTTLRVSGPDINLLDQIIETELEKVFDWLVDNKLMINLTRTHSMLFTNKRGERKISIKAHNSEYEQKSECHFLGLIVDEVINWKPHIHFISNDISKTIALLRLLKHIFLKHISKAF